MNTYIDTEGNIVQAEQLTGPTILNTINGEVAPSAGDWVLYLPNGRLAVLSAAQFQVSFTLA